MNRNRLITAAVACVMAGLPLLPFTRAQDATPVATSTPPTTLPATAPAGAAPEDTLDALTQSVQALSKEIHKLPPDEAAKRWVDAYDRFAKMAHASREEAKAAGDRFVGAFGRGSVLDRLMDALPPPAAWPALARAIDARPIVKEDPPAAEQDKRGEDRGNWEWGAPDPAVRDAGMRMLAHVLANDDAAQKRDLDALKALLKLQPNRAYTPAGNHIEQLSQLLTGAAANPEGALKQFEDQLAQARRGDATQLDVPDLVKLLGNDRADALLRQAIVIRGRLQFTDAYDAAPNPTKRLAQRIALALVPEMKRPHWELVDVGAGETSLALYAALDKRFPFSPAKRGGALLDKLFGRDQQEWSVEEERTLRMQARAAHIVCLVIAGRGDDAARAAAELRREPEAHDADGDGIADAVNAFDVDYQASTAIREAVDGPKAYAALARLLRDHPGLPLWDELRGLAVRIGKADDALALARAAAGRPGLSPEARRDVLRELCHGLLAADQVDEGVQVMRELLKPDPPAAPRNAGAGDGAAAILPRAIFAEANAFNHDGRGDVALSLAKLGLLLKHPQWVDEGIAAARGVLARPQADDESYDWSRQQFAGRLAETLAEAGRGGDAVTLLSDTFTRQRDAARRRAALQGQGAFAGSYNPTQDRALLLRMMSVYHRTHRHADVREMLDAVPYWSAKDLAEFFDEKDDDANPAGYLAAAALLAGDKVAEARKLIDAVLDANPGFDPAYELLLRTFDPADAKSGDAAIARLDALFKRDPFEERPLIWKAVVLREQKELDDAERVLRQAIAIDPSDGEQPRGRRVRAYAVLADVLADKGNAKDAGVYRNIVKAIRTSEDADQLHQAGLLSRGIKLYEESLQSFQDAYCIQARLAVQLAEQGRMDEAEAHYRRAFELMPDSFGRVESHCFGCEGAFTGERAQSIAERVFTALLAKHPERPQLYYLLAYLREQQGRYADALPLLREAVRLDPDYLNAWRHLHDLSEHLSLPPADADAAAVNLIRLDPLNRHGQSTFKHVHDLKALWAAAEAAGKLRTPPPTALYALAASAAEVAKAGEEGAANAQALADPFKTEESPDAPASVVWSTEVMQAIRGLVVGD